MLDYTSIKQLAKQIGRPTKDLVVLAPANDPYYAGVPGRQREAEWFAEIWRRFGFSNGVHLRRIHYVLVSQRQEGDPILKPGDQPYENTNGDWSLLARASLSARHLAKRVQETGKPARIIYMSDFDPAGRAMPVSVARKLEFYIGKFDFDVDVTLNPLVLTEDQCQHYRLPRTPIKETESRRSKFEEKFGAGATELDALEALHPGDMGKLLEAEIDRYFDPILAHRCNEARWRLQSQLTAIEQEVTEPRQEEIDHLTSTYEEIVADLEAWERSAEDLWSTITEELQEEQENLPALERPKPRPANEPDGFVLFDSKRGYFHQIDAYREWQRR